MGHLSYDEGKKVVFKGLILLGVITLIEVFIALLGKGYIVEGFHLPVWLMYFSMISLSLYKAYFIVYEFMHMKYEAPGLVKSVLLPTLLLIWAVIAFFSEGRFWKRERAFVNDRPIAAFTAPVKHENAKEDHVHPLKHDQEATIKTDSTASDQIKEEPKTPEQTQHH
jgi:cytochrome c oxidase subunit IV